VQARLTEQMMLKTTQKVAKLEYIYNSIVALFIKMDYNINEILRDCCFMAVRFDRICDKNTFGVWAKWRGGAIFEATK
jgi:hypothetical protein